LTEAPGVPAIEIIAPPRRRNIAAESPFSPTDGEDMTDLPANPQNVSDGRQSAAALEIARGTRRLLLSHGMASLTEMSLANGRRADLIALGERGTIWIVEIKSSVEDFRADRKWPDYRESCDQLFFAVGPEFPRDLIPAEVGLIIADRFGAELARDAIVHPLATARRKSLITRFARVSAMRLHALADPEQMLERSWID
jgi:hypothetical protein